MDIELTDEKDKILVIYLDNITIFSKYDEEHVTHLLRTFKKCRKFGISLNPKKSFFAMKEGNFLRNTISQEGIKIDPKRIKDIRKIQLPGNPKEEVQSFLGKVNFLIIFNAPFAETVKYITNMLGNDQEIWWMPESRQSFEVIKNSIAKELIIRIPHFSKYFLIFLFSSKHKVGVLLRKNH